MNKVIKVFKITYQSLCKLLDLGYTVIVHNPEANIIKPPKKLHYEAPKKPTYIPEGRFYRRNKLLREAFLKGKIK